MTFTGVLGQEVNGIWEKYTDTNDVNAVDANFDAETVVTGDDFGLVKLFKFPCLKKGKYLLTHDIASTFSKNLLRSLKG